MNNQFLSRQQIIDKLTEQRGGDSLKEFSGKIGISLSGLCNILNGLRKPGPKVLRYLSKGSKEELQEVDAYHYVLRRKNRETK